MCVQHRAHKCAGSRAAMTPRKSAAKFLPQLDREFGPLKATFGPGVTLEVLSTPDGTWGQDETEGWPRVNGVDLHAPWSPTAHREAMRIQIPAVHKRGRQ